MRILLLLMLFLFPISSTAEKAEKIDPKAQALRLFNDGVFQMKREKYETAREKFADAIKKQPKLAEAYNNYAYCTRMLSDQNYEEALKFYDTAIKLKPKLAVAYQYRGCLHVLMGNKDLAIDDYRTLVKLDKDLAQALEEFIKSEGKTEEEKNYATSF